MADRRIVVDNLKLEYEGLFVVNELYRIMDKWFREKGFDKFEKRSSDRIFKDSKELEFEWEPWKKVNDYAKEVMKIKFLFTDIKDVEVVKDHHKVKMQHGKVYILINGYLETDWEHKWEATPLLYFIRAFFDQVIYKQYLDQFYTLVADDTMHLYDLARTYLNMQKY